MDISSRIKILRNDLKLSQKEFAEAVGFSQSYVCSVENGTKHPSADFLIRISRLFGVKVLWLSKGFGEMFSNSQKNEFKMFVREPDTYYEFPHKISSILSKIERGDLFSFEVESDNMEPCIRKGDEVLIDKTDRSPENNSIFLFEINSRKVLKHCFKIGPATLKLTNDRPLLKNNDMILDNSIKCLGRLVWIIRKVE